MKSKSVERRRVEREEILIWIEVDAVNLYAMSVLSLPIVGTRLVFVMVASMIMPVNAEHVILTCKNMPVFYWGIEREMEQIVVHMICIFL